MDFKFVRELRLIKAISVDSNTCVCLYIILFNVFFSFTRSVHVLYPNYTNKFSMIYKLNSNLIHNKRFFFFSRTREKLWKVKTRSFIWSSLITFKSRITIFNFFFLRLFLYLSIMYCFSIIFNLLFSFIFDECSSFWRWVRRSSTKSFGHHYYCSRQLKLMRLISPN